MEPKTPQIHALTIFLLVVLAGKIVLAEGRHIKSSKPPNFNAATKATDQFGRIATPAQGTGQTDPFRKPDAAKDQINTIVAHSLISDDVVPVKSYTNGLFTDHKGQLSNLQHPGNDESNKLELHLHTSYLPSANASGAKSYTNGQITEKRRFQEMTATESAQDNGRKPPPRVSTVPGHSPGDGN